MTRLDPDFLRGSANCNENEPEGLGGDSRTGERVIVLVCGFCSCLKLESLLTGSGHVTWCFVLLSGIVVYCVVIIVWDV